MSRATRTEHDLLGDYEFPVDAYYGVHTERARRNLQITGTSIAAFPDLIIALAHVKQAAAQANCELGLLASFKHDAIVAACEELELGVLHDQLVVGVIQGAQEPPRT